MGNTRVTKRNGVISIVKPFTQRMQRIFADGAK